MKFQGASTGDAVELAQPLAYEKPKEITEATGLSRPPQSFAHMQ